MRLACDTNDQLQAANADWGLKSDFGSCLPPPIPFSIPFGTSRDLHVVSSRRVCEIASFSYFHQVDFSRGKFEASFEQVSQLLRLAAVRHC